MTCLSPSRRRSSPVVRVMLAIFADPVPAGGGQSIQGRLYDDPICTAEAESFGASVRVTS
jgi:hypothetical protein